MKLMNALTIVLVKQWERIIIITINRKTENKFII